MENRILNVILITICALLIVIVGVSRDELDDIKVELQDANGIIEEMKAQNDALNEELAAQIARAEQAEEELESYNSQVYYAPSYGSAWYESDDADAEQAAKDWIAWRESGGNYEARNGQYYGKFQLQQDMLGDDLSPEHQEERADEYVASRYGSWQAAKEFWQTNGWY